jgi:hypothetical protein
MKAVCLLFITAIISPGIFAQLNDTTALVYTMQPSFKMARKHKIAGNTLTAFGFATLGVGLLFGMGAISEAQKEASQYPTLVVDGFFGTDTEMEPPNTEKYLYPAIGFIGASIPLLVVGSIERRKARLSLYAAGRERMVVSIGNPAQQMTMGLTLSIPLGKLTEGR